MDSNEVFNAIATQYTFTTTSVAIPAAGFVQLCQNNPNRWGLFLGGLGGGVAVAPDSSLNPGVGGLLIDNPPLFLNLRDHAMLPMVEWFAVGGVGNVIRVIEIVRS